MKIAKSTEQIPTKFKSVIVRVLVSGEALEGKQKGRTVYTTFQSIEVQETKPDEVYSVVMRALENAANRK